MAAMGDNCCQRPDAWSKSWCQLNIGQAGIVLAKEHKKKAGPLPAECFASREADEGPSRFSINEKCRLSW